MHACDDKAYGTHAPRTNALQFVINRSVVNTRCHIKTISEPNRDISATVVFLYALVNFLAMQVLLKFGRLIFQHKYIFQIITSQYSNEQIRAVQLARMLQYARIRDMNRDSLHRGRSTEKTEFRIYMELQSNIDRLSQLFNWTTQQNICDTLTDTDSTTP